MYKRFTNRIGSQQGVGDSRKGTESKASGTVASALLRGKGKNSKEFVHISKIKPSRALKKILYGKRRT